MNVHREDAGAAAGHRGRTVRRWSFVMLVALLVQFGIGMYVNLFTTIPLNHPGHGARNYLTGTFRSVAWAETSPHSPFILATHTGLGLLLVVASVWVAIVAVRSHRRLAAWAATLGALCIIGAGFNGGSFLDYNKEVSSYIMALLSAAAVLCYAVVLALPAQGSRQ